VDFVVRAMTEEDARAIADWHYEGEYAFYDFERDPDDLAELLDPGRWGVAFFSVGDDDGQLVGFFEFLSEGDVVEIGLGLRPDFTGKGYGLSLVEAGITFARQRFSPRVFRVRVAAFNERAAKVYRRAGFRVTGRTEQIANGAAVEFLDMERYASPDALTPWPPLPEGEGEH